jgi:transcriptional regulator with XRE-family HTH domain
MSFTQPSGGDRTFGQVLRAAREARALSQESLADLSGISRTFISEIERGNSSPTLDALTRISVGLGVRLSEIIIDWENNG